MKTARLSFILMLLILTFTLFFQAYQLPIFRKNGMIGVGFFPVVVSAILLILESFVFISTLLKSKPKNKELIHYSFRSFIKQGVLLISLLIAIFLSTKLGMLATIFLFLFLLLNFVENTSWLHSFLISLGCVTIIYLVFVFWLEMTLPKGIIF